MRKLREEIGSRDFFNVSRKSNVDFTRNRKLGFVDIILYQLSNMSRSLAVELSDYFKEKLGNPKSYTKQAYSKGRMKIKPESYISLNNLFQSEYYCEPHKCYKGYRLLGIDGSIIELPHGQELESKFGKINKESTCRNGARSSLIYDLLNKQVIDATLERYESSEKAIGIKQLVRIKEEGRQRKDIIVADRGYPSVELLMELEQLGYDYVIRFTPSRFIKGLEVLEKGKKKDIEIELNLSEFNKRRKNQRIGGYLSNHPESKLRIRGIAIELENGVKEYLITSLRNKLEFGDEDFREIYSERWNQEVYYDFQKNVMQVEDFTGKTEDAVLQDYHSRILVGNIHSMMVSEAEKEEEQAGSEHKELKYKEYRINRNVSYGLLKGRIYDMLRKENKNWDEEYDQIKEEIKRYKIPVRKGRKYEHKTKGKLKYPMNNKRVF